MTVKDMASNEANEAAVASSEEEVGCIGSICEYIQGCCSYIWNAIYNFFCCCFSSKATQEDENDSGSAKDSHLEQDSGSMKAVTEDKKSLLSVTTGKTVAQ